MSIIIGYSALGLKEFSDEHFSINTIKYTEVSGSVVEELSLRESTTGGLDNVKETWHSDFAFLGKFLNSLEAGNISNDGIKIIRFKVLRRLANQPLNEDIFLGTVPFDPEEDTNLSFTDSTQSNNRLIYTIVPLSEAGTEGESRSVEVESDFTGYWIVDKDTNEVLTFDKALGSMGTFESTYNKDRTIIETFSKYPRVIYSDKGYHTFTLTSTFLPNEWERSGDEYQRIMTNFVNNPKPFLVKSGDGRVFVGDVGNPRASSPQNAWRGHDYFTLSLDFVETMDVKEYLEGV